ncbi:MAG: CinA family protein [Burkholderiaceae bacterium]
MTHPTQLTEAGEAVAQLLRQNKQTVAVAESSTGGLISASLLSIPGASEYFLGGSVVYTMQSRKALLGVRRNDVEGLEPLTREMAAKFAEIARLQMGTTWGLAELGAAGPTGTRYGHPPGISVVAVDGPVKTSIMVETGSQDREENMWVFTRRALALLAEAIESKP